MILRRLINSLFVFILFFQTVLGNITDSLENRLNRATTDTAKVMIYNSFARDVMSGRSRDYYQILRFAQQGGQNHYHQALQIAQEGLLLADQIQFDKGRAELHRTIGNAYFHIIDYEQAIEHYEQALNICKYLNDNNGIALNYFNIALVYNHKKSNIFYSLEILQKALSIWKQTGNTALIMRAYGLIIDFYREVGEQQLALTYSQEALDLAIETGNRIEEASLYNIIAQINFSIDNKEEAEEYFQKSLNLYEELGDQLQMARIMHNIATTLHMNNSEIAIDLLRTSASIFEKLVPKNRQIFVIYNSIAEMYHREKNTDSTRYYKEKALNKAIFSGNQQSMATAYNTTGMYYMNLGDINRAEKDFRKALDIALKLGLYNIQSSALSALSTISYRKGDYKNAVEFLQRHRVIKDSLNSEEINKNIDQLTMQYEFEKDMKEQNATFNAQFERQQQAIKHQRNIVTIVSIALIIASVMIVFIIRNNNHKRKTNKKLAQQHSEILRINDELQKSHQELSKYKDGLEEMVKEQMDKVQQKEIQLHTISNNLPGGCIYQKHLYNDGNEFISYISTTAEEWLGISAENIISDINILYKQIVPEDLENKRKLEQNSILSMSSYSCTFRLMKGDQEVWLLENAMPRADRNQSIVWDGIIVDITDRKKFEKELIAAILHAEESDRLKTAFLANMSHEIRTPMNAIVGFLNFIERDNLADDKRSTYTNIVRNNVRQLLQLIEDIIDISKIDSRQMSLSNVCFDLNEMLEEMDIFFHDFIMKNDKKLALYLDRSHFITPNVIKLDQFRLRQILSNLIGNAIKFTEKGYIKFGYTLSENHDKLYFFVEDTGIGIPESKRSYIFERFKQAYDEKTKTLVRGTGLGLTISKNLVELMGGEIGVESEEGVGSKFYFTLPYILGEA